MYFYNAYGLGIHSALPLPELVAGEAVANVVVRLGKVDRVPSAVDGTGAGFWATTEAACYFLEGVGAFLVRSGREIIIDLAPGVEERVLRLVILGPVLALLLHQRERFVLHASSVAVSGGAVTFLGGRGCGKSTLAAALYMRGHSILADDVTAVNVSTGCPTVSAGFPQLKLWPEAIVSLGEAAETLAKLHPLSEKRAHRVTQEFSQRPFPLRRIYVLGGGSAPAIEPLRPQEALIELMRHWYGARFGMELLESLGISSFFLQCVNLANKVSVCRLKRPPSLSALPDVAQLVEEHLARDIRLNVA